MSASTCSRAKAAFSQGKRIQRRGKESSGQLAVSMLGRLGAGGGKRPGIEPRAEVRCSCRQRAAGQV